MDTDMTEKIIGYILLAVGLLIIILAAFSSYEVFTKKAAPVGLFQFSGISIDLSQTLTASLPKELSQTGYTLPPLQQEIISGNMINQPMNFFAYLIFMGFMSSIGVKIAGLGIQLIRPTVIKMPDTQKVTPSTGAK